MWDRFTISPPASRGFMVKDRLGREAPCCFLGPERDGVRQRTEASAPSIPVPEGSTHYRALQAAQVGVFS